MTQYCTELIEEHDAYSLAEQSKMICKQLGFGEYEADLLALATSEIAMNAIIHGGGGTATVAHTPNANGIEVVINDTGTGIANLSHAMQDGVSSKTSLGLGLGAANRAVEKMDIQTSPTGTTVSLTKYLPLHEEMYDIGIVSFPAVNASINGDGYVVVPYHGNSMLVAVLDGAGSGEKANSAVKFVSKILKEQVTLALPELLTLVHKTLIEQQVERSVELAVARIQPHKIELCTLGNVKAVYKDSDYHSLHINSGALGLNLPDPLQTTQLEPTANWQLLLCTDGIQLSHADEPLTLTSSARKQAEALFDKYAVAQDDATLLIVKANDNAIS